MSAKSIPSVPRIPKKEDAKPSKKVETPEFQVQNPVENAPEAKQEYLDINNPKHGNKTYEDLQNS